MVLASPPSAPESPPLAPAANRALLSGITWDTLEKLDQDLAGSGARLTYLDGWLEIMAPLSDEHEEPRKTVSLILEAYLRLRKIRFYGRGSTTIGQKALGGRKEPDESYCFGERKAVPDLAIEVTVTSGGIDVLEIYRRIGVQEVWFWEDGRMRLYGLRVEGEMGSAVGSEAGSEARYEPIDRSELLSEFDIALVERCSRMVDQYDAVNAFIESLG
jgi:Uma2 family endonuclease